MNCITHQIQSVITVSRNLTIDIFSLVEGRDESCHRCYNNVAVIDDTVDILSWTRYTWCWGDERRDKMLGTIASSRSKHAKFHSSISKIFLLFFFFLGNLIFIVIAQSSLTYMTISLLTFYARDSSKNYFDGSFFFFFFLKKRIY